MSKVNWLVGYSTLDSFFDHMFLREHDHNLLGYGGGLTYRSLFGPISFMVAGNNHNTGVKMYLSVGFNFASIK